MTQRSIMWDGTTIGDAALAPYPASRWWDLWSYGTGFGTRANYGVFRGSGNTTFEALQVTPTSPVSTQITVKPGGALVDGTLYYSDADENLTVAANASGNPRIDTVILRKDFTAQTVRLAIKQGTPAATPSAPALTQSGSLWEIPLADIAVANLFASISAADIRQNAYFVNAADGVYLDNVLNNSGILLEDGDIVVISTGSDLAMTTTTTLDDTNALGVVRGRVEIGGYGRVQISGVGYVRLNAASTARGLGITTSTTARQGAVSINTARIGYTLQTTAGAGYCLALINCVSRRRVDYLKFSDQKASGTAGGTSAAAAYQTRTLTTEDYDAGGFGSLAANQITLQPGEYTFRGVTPARGTAQLTRARLRNITAGTTVAFGTNTASPTDTMLYSEVTGRFVISAPTVFELQQYTAVSVATTGLGSAVSSGDSEVYSVIEFWRWG